MFETSARRSIHYTSGPVFLQEFLQDMRARTDTTETASRWKKRIERRQRRRQPWARGVGRRSRHVGTGTTRPGTAVRGWNHAAPLSLPAVRALYPILQ